MGTMSIWHWLIVLAIVVVVFGTKKLGNIGKDLGSAVKGFKDGMRDGQADDAAATAAAPAQISEQAAKARGEGPDKSPSLDQAAASKRWVYGCLGAPSTCAALPASTTSPSLSTMTSWAMARTTATSCVIRR